MAIVTVKNKYQVVIPRHVREQIGVAIGDVLEARAVRGKIVFEPKSIVDRGIAEGLEDIRKGRVHGPYRSVPEAMKAFRERTTRLSKRPQRTSS
jgi:AbrB family looped-hinge helix DNA binding protein